MSIRLTDATMAPAVREFLDAADLAPNDGRLTKEEVIRHWGSLKNLQQQLAGRFNLFADFDAGKVTAIIRRTMETESMMMIGGAAISIHFAEVDHLIDDVLRKDLAELRNGDLVKRLSALIQEGTTESERAAIYEAAADIERVYMSDHVGQEPSRWTLTLSRLEYWIERLGETEMSRPGAVIRIFSAMVEQVLRENPAHSGEAYLMRWSGLARLFSVPIMHRGLTNSGFLNLEAINRRITPEMVRELTETLAAIRQRMGEDVFERMGFKEMFLRGLETVDDLQNDLMGRATAEYGAQQEGNERWLTKETVEEISEIRRALAHASEHEAPLIRAITCIELALYQRSSHVYQLPPETQEAIRTLDQRMAGLTTDADQRGEVYRRLERPVFDRLLRR